MVRYLYKHEWKGEVWSRKSPIIFKKENGSGWKFIKKVSEAKFRSMD